MERLTRQGETGKNNGGVHHLHTLLEDARRKVRPYPPMDVHEHLSWSRETIKGKTVKAITLTTLALLVGMALYGMITHDREILLALIDFLQFLLGALLAWAVGKWRLLKAGKDKHEEEEDSG